MKYFAALIVLLLVAGCGRRIKSFHEQNKGGKLMSDFQEKDKG